MRQRSPLLVCTALLLAGQSAHGAGAPLDVELLEFLGSLDGDDAEFIDYLEQRPASPAGKVPVKNTAPAPAADPKQVKKP